MFELFKALITANQRLNLVLFLWFLITSGSMLLPPLGGSGLLSGYVLLLFMASVIKVVKENQDPERVKRALSEKGVWELLKETDKLAVAGAYLGMMVNTFAIGLASIIFTAFLMIPVILKQIKSAEYTAIYIALVCLLALYVAFNLFFTATVAMAKGLTENDFSSALKETLKGLTPKYFLLSLKPGLWKPSVGITLITILALIISVIPAIILGMAGIPFSASFGATSGVIIFHANVAYHFTCMKIMELV